MAQMAHLDGRLQPSTTQQHQEMEKEMKFMSAILAFCALALVSSVAFANCDCEIPSITGEQIYLVQTSVGDSIPDPNLADYGESGIPDGGGLPVTINPITFHQANVDFGSFYRTNEVNGPCDLWSTTE
jgi:hypothetical protein